ncbi:methyltransferase domain-containing protein [Roseomonas sp. SSH11]|uniref:Methyltransferase domain-containing protein n=1 Tax=Pararoseomonas baculiformis TaxID=2820812 RepID=A0ABS4AG17_9PROT|nr:methyltransferase domain-containing protein [Pararoseomonas baculiformis]MBP0445463.1 methyltransferase domain-containing protein [Pararoseomonas baculiformis]
MLRARSSAPEIMDDAAQDFAAFSAALHDLERINRMSLAYRPTLRWLDALARRTGARRMSVLDVGAGGGDMLARVADWGARRGVALDLAALDRSPHAEAHARARHPGLPVRWITADLFELDPAERFDAVICALFTHHLDEPQLVLFLRWMESRARLGWFISDLHRHPLPWGVVWAGVRLLRMDPMVVHDSTVSIARGFSRADWRRLAAQAGVPARLRWAFPFRWTLAGGTA